MPSTIERTAVPPIPVQISSMTLRDYFAIHVVSDSLKLSNSDDYEREAEERYKFADAMLKARRCQIG